MEWFARRRPGYLRLINAVRPYLAPEATIFDVGANIGYFTLVLAEETGFRGKAYLFEPVPNLAKLCRKTLESARFDAEICEYGLGDEDGEIDIYLAADGNLGWNTMIAKKASKGMMPVRIKVRKFDTCGIDAVPSFIKVDVEGAEYRVFRGMMGSLAKWPKKPVILCEIGWGTAHPEWNEELAVFDELVRLGYSTRTLEGAALDVRTIAKTTDILFLPPPA